MVEVPQDPDLAQRPQAEHLVLERRDPFYRNTRRRGHVDSRIYHPVGTLAHYLDDSVGICQELG